MIEKDKNNYKIFCDESNYMLNDTSDIMINGAIKIDETYLLKVKKYIKYLRHKYSYYTEIKWTKLLTKQWNFYKELIDYFFDSDFMQFKATLVVNKSNAIHKKYNRDHNEFYYVVYYYTLRDMMDLQSNFKIYFDYKDSLGGERVRKLKEILSYKGYQNSEFTIIQSNESQLIQLCDVFVGAIGYANREDIQKNSKIKKQIVEYLDNKIRKSCQSSCTIFQTKPWEKKFNIFRWSLQNDI